MLYYPFSLELRSEEDDPIRHHLIPENRDFEPKVRKLEANRLNLLGTGIDARPKPHY